MNNSIEEVLEKYRANSFIPKPFEADLKLWDEKRKKLQKEALKEAISAIEQYVLEARIMGRIDVHQIIADGHTKSFLNVLYKRDLEGLKALQAKEANDES